MYDRCATCEPVTYGASTDNFPQYIHCSGGMFVMIPDIRTTSPRNEDGTHRKVTVGSYKDYIARTRSGTDSVYEFVAETEKYRIGYLWSWNYMLTKRWRSNNTGDEHFQDKMLADFRDFCANKDNRLRDYWDDCKETSLVMKPLEVDEEMEIGLELTAD